MGKQESDDEIDAIIFQGVPTPDSSHESFHGSQPGKRVHRTVTEGHTFIDTEDE